MSIGVQLYSHGSAAIPASLNPLGGSPPTHRLPLPILPLTRPAIGGSALYIAQDVNQMMYKLSTDVNVLICTPSINVNQLMCILLDSVNILMYIFSGQQMSVKKTARKQAIRWIDTVAQQATGLRQPRGGWIAALRDTLGLSVIQLASRLSISRIAIYQAERNEVKGAITLSQMRKIADAMDADLVYALVPRQPVGEILEAQALRKAEAVVRRAHSHMNLEGQDLSEEKLKERIRDLADDLLRDPPRDFWTVA